jgi:manganese-dependent ADP-ribose/CDP-alcohol diphosphatase
MLHAGPASCSGRLFSIGIISDVQYADIPDGRSFKGVPRYYREALPALQRAVAAWRARGVDFAMHFGAPAQILIDDG